MKNPKQLIPNLTVCQKCQHFLDIGPDIQQGDGTFIHTDQITLLCTVYYNPICIGEMNHITKYFIPANDGEAPPISCPYLLEHTIQ